MHLIRHTVAKRIYLVGGEIGVSVCDVGVRCDASDCCWNVAQFSVAEAVEEAGVPDHCTNVVPRPVIQRTQLIATQAYL